MLGSGPLTFLGVSSSIHIFIMSFPHASVAALVLLFFLPWKLKIPNEVTFYA